MGVVQPHVWYHSQALEAARFYVSLIPNSEIRHVRNASAGVPDVPEGAPFIVEFTLDGMPVTAISGGPAVTLNEAFSLMIRCADQGEVDRYWDALVADGGEPGPCGWLKDRFGLSWQVVPAEMDDLVFAEGEPGRRAMATMLGQSKIDLAAIRAAHAGRG